MIWMNKIGALEVLAEVRKMDRRTREMTDENNGGRMKHGGRRVDEHRRLEGEPSSLTHGGRHSH